MVNERSAAAVSAARAGEKAKMAGRFAGVFPNRSFRLAAGLKVDGRRWEMGS